MTPQSPFKSLIVNFVNRGDDTVRGFSDALKFFPTFPDGLEYICDISADNPNDGFIELSRNNTYLFKVDSEFTLTKTEKWQLCKETVEGTGLAVNEGAIVRVVGYKNFLFFECDGEVGFAPTDAGYCSAAMEIVENILRKHYAPSANCFKALSKAWSTHKLYTLSKFSCLDCIKVIASALHKSYREKILAACANNLND